MPSGSRIPGDTAWRNLLASKASRWTYDRTDRAAPESASARLAGGIAIPRVTPKFTLRDDDVFFCIGSCFARNIEEHLLYRNARVASKGIAAVDAGVRPNAFINKFTTGSMLNEVRWSLGGEPFPAASIVEDDGAYRDLQLAQCAALLPLDEAEQRRREVTSYFRMLAEATVVVITLGLVETWYDHEADCTLNVAPSLWVTRRFPGRFSVYVADYADNLTALQAVLDALFRYGNPDLRAIVTVSPVPMKQTFTGEDVLTANTYSKSTLRAVAEDAARGRPSVQYFPSYEMITVSNRSLTFNPIDGSHVLDTAVETVVSAFLTTYGITAKRPHPEFVELDYLLANPDVRTAVGMRRFSSGYAHWLEHGKGEGRPLRETTRSRVLDRLVGARASAD